MIDYLEIFAQWYPEVFGEKYYPSRQISKVFTESERSWHLEKLNRKQLKILEEHRKYKYRSLFLEHNYLKDTEWKFVDFKIDNHYRQDRGDNTTQLKCLCGRVIKYQFIVKSKRTNRQLELGINHFSDHLQIPLNVAQEIKNGISKIDIGLDEILYLKNTGVLFPEGLWQRYCYAIYRNSQLINPVSLNRKLAKRVYDFRQVKLPIYIIDNLSLEDEIKKVNSQSNNKEEILFYDNKKIYETFIEDFTSDLIDGQLFIRDVFQDYSSISNNKRKISNLYFKRMYELLKEKNDSLCSKTSWSNFIQSTVGRQVDRKLNNFIMTQYLKRGFSPNFFLSIPKEIQEGLYPIYKLNKLKEIKKREQHFANLNRKFYRTFLQILNIDDEKYRLLCLEVFIKDDEVLKEYTDEILEASRKWRTVKNYGKAFTRFSPTLARALEENSLYGSFPEFLINGEEDKSGKIDQYVSELFYLWMKIPRSDKVTATSSLLSKITKLKNDENKTYIDYLDQDGKKQVFPNTKKFYSEFIPLLQNSEEKSEDDICGEINTLFEKYDISNWDIAFNLLAASYRFNLGIPFNESFSDIVPEIRYHLEKYFISSN